MTQRTRRMLLVTHPNRAEAMSATEFVCGRLLECGVQPVLSEDVLERLRARHLDFVDRLESYPVDGPISGEVELAMVLGGDGTILRAAEMVRDASVPLLGVNLGHVGFLAESERHDLASTVQRAVDRDYQVEERMAIDVTVLHDGSELYRSWALNEVSVEKVAREKMLWVTIEVNARPLSSFGCDGVVMATPTGSTAYSFSGGGPIVWPSVEAMLMVPLSAHALFARPLVVGPTAILATELGGEPGVMWCDGRRMFDLPADSRVEVRRSPCPVRLARLYQGLFVDRLVKKFSLPVAGWRGPQGAADGDGAA